MSLIGSKNMERLDGETGVQHLKRLIDGFETGIYDVSHEDIVKQAFGTELSPTESRKRLYGCKMTLKLIEDDVISLLEGEELLEEIKQQTLTSQKEKIKMQDQKRELMKVVREWARAEHIYDHIRDMAEVIAEGKPLLPKPNIEYDNEAHREGAILLSDWHVGLFAHNYWNDFDMDEFYRRVRRLIDKVIEHGKNNRIKVLHVFLLGDLISGLIHVTTRINNTEDVAKQTQIVSELLAEIMVEFADNFEEIKLYSVRGNHDRITANKRDEIARESFASFIDFHLETRLKNIDNIEIFDNKYDDEIAVATICGKYKVFGVHGHKDKVNSAVENLSLMTKEIPDYVVMGHLHHNFSTEVHSVEIIGNPSLSGVDDFAKDIRRTSKPAQKFLVFDEKESLLNTYAIRLDI